MFGNDNKMSIADKYEALEKEMEAKKRLLLINEPFLLPFDLQTAGLKVTKRKNVFEAHIEFVHSCLINAFQ